MKNSRISRVAFRKNRHARRRQTDVTRQFENDGDVSENLASSERISGKGELTRKRTVKLPAVKDGVDSSRNENDAWRGQVLHAHGLDSFVLDESGQITRCAIRQVLHDVATDQRHPVSAGDWVHVQGRGEEAAICFIEPRRSALSRSSRGRRHTLVANLDQLFIVGSAAQPDLKPGLIDRMLVAAESAGIRPVICINKIDLIDPAELLPLAGVYARMGYPVILCSSVTGYGLSRLRIELDGQVTAVVGQSGVGKSSLLNRLEPELELPVSDVSRDNEKGRHTTTVARLLPHSYNGSFVDTPGVRQFQLWETVPAEVPSAFRDLRPLANHCRYPDCSHSHESGCAVKDAVADGLLDTRRWESCCHLAAGAEDSRE